MHLINYKTDKKVDKVSVKLNSDYYKNARLLTPENGEARELVFDAEGFVTVEGLDIYLVIGFEK